ncbi:hypothetical protein EN943_07510 [Mesorhizobium sp. M7A.F.Ca.US.006.01.1.1]|uniref:hypothetical protein n=1 Tax=Mesorhizobium sp. M7A.F.Ca.US.006.01.1.1 TaxID=2496707 RepID=UPI000FCAB367|nr:hypothetical protein [Mesorhizobium sp. M7A.F.Ca.US.006.01.1.1]RUZ79412.1 hypothetical protein EN943_07510 [Mesorhizobium sp. M7A.F.Ca.US.006.01.1.1]
MKRADAIQTMHDRCAIYTASETAARLLDVVGWTADQDLSTSVFLEPCAGEGAILVEAVERLIASFRRHGHRLAKRRLMPRINAFEFYGPVAAEARRAVRLVLMREGIRWDTSGMLAEVWVRQADFLLQPPENATHIAANPPYLRWSKLPLLLAVEYRANLRPMSTRGDVAVAFLDRMLVWAGNEGQISALVSDRWMFAQYGAAFIADLKERGWNLEVVDDQPVRPFVRQVGVSSAIVRLDRNAPEAEGEQSRRDAARTIHGRLLARYGALDEAGCTVKVGPALGCGDTFLISNVEAAAIESELVRPFVSREMLDGTVIEQCDAKVVVPYDRAGHPIEFEDWPRFARWAGGHKEKLRARSHVTDEKRWWRTIDAVGPQWDERPKLLLAEMCRDIAATIDRTGGIPSHSVYAIWSTEWPIEALQRVLNGGLLRLTAEAEAPRLKGSWFRFYKRFIVCTPLPKWPALSIDARTALIGRDVSRFAAAYAELFEHEPTLSPGGDSAD